MINGKPMNNGIAAKILVGTMILLLASTTAGGFMAWRELAVVSSQIDNLEARLDSYNERLRYLERRENTAALMEDQYFVYQKPY